MAPREVSSIVQVLMMLARDSLKLITFNNARPTKPALISDRYGLSACVYLLLEGGIWLELTSLTTSDIRITASIVTIKSRANASHRWIQNKR